MGWLVQGEAKDDEVLEVTMEAGQLKWGEELGKGDKMSKN